MTEHTNLEPVWVGMDVDAELARYAEEDRRGADAEALAAPGPKRFPRRRSLLAPISSLGVGAVPQAPVLA